MTLENLPIIYLIIMAIGMCIILIGILRLAQQGDVLETKPKNEPELSDVFHYFLQEEEKKNNDVRAMLMQMTTNDTKAKTVQNEVQKKHSQEKDQSNEDFINIIRRYQKGETIDQIAKALGKGVGEVKLIISLYAAENQ